EPSGEVDPENDEKTQLITDRHPPSSRAPTATHPGLGRASGAVVSVPAAVSADPAPATEWQHDNRAGRQPPEHPGGAVSYTPPNGNERLSNPAQVVPPAR